MLKHKISFLEFQADQMEAFAEYLEQQASKGWFLDCKKADIIPFPVFKRGTPENKRYSVVMIPNISQWDTDNDSRIVEYRQMCEEYGWEYVGSYRKFRIFSSENLDAVPIDTDPNLWFETVGREQLTRIIPCYLVLCILFMIQSRSLFRNPSWNLVNNEMVWAGAAQVAVGFVMVFLAVKSIIWYLRTRARVRSGRPIKKTALKNVKISSYVVLTVLLFMIISVFLAGGSSHRFLFGLIVLIVSIIPLVICGVIFKVIKRRGSGSDGENRILYFVLSFFCIFLFLGFFDMAVFRLMPDRSDEWERTQEKEEEFPLDPSAFGYEWDDSRYAGSDSSILASLQSGAYQKKDGEAIAGTLFISLYTARYNWVYNCLYADMKPNYGNAYEVTGPESFRMGDMTIEFYNYEIPDTESQKRFIYVVQKGNDIMRLDFYMQEDKELIHALLEQFNGWNG